MNLSRNCSIGKNQ